MRKPVKEIEELSPWLNHDYKKCHSSDVDRTLAFLHSDYFKKFKKSALTLNPPLMTLVLHVYANNLDPDETQRNLSSHPDPSYTQTTFPSTWSHGESL